MRTQEMLTTHPRMSSFDLDRLARCISATTECADICTSCADACLSEENLQNLRKCIRLNMDCADICDTTARLLTRQTDPDPQLVRMQIETCATACRLCAQECEKHAEMHKHCRVCAAACRDCEQACQQFLAA